MRRAIFVILPIVLGLTSIAGADDCTGGVGDVAKHLNFCATDHGFNEGAACGLEALANTTVKLPADLGPQVLGNTWDRTNMMGATKAAWKLGAKEAAIKAVYCCQEHSHGAQACLKSHRDLIVKWLDAQDGANTPPTDAPPGWISGLLSNVDPGMQWVGGKSQTVYSGKAPRTYKLSATVRAGTDRSTGVWVTDSTGRHPVPNYPLQIDAKGDSVSLDLDTRDPTRRTEALWIDNPQHDNVDCGGGATNRTLNGPNKSTVRVYKGTAEKVFRFTSQRNPSGVWVNTGVGPDQPVPTYPTAIEVGGTNLSVVLKDTLHPNDPHGVCWLDVTK